MAVKKKIDGKEDDPTNLWGKKVTPIPLDIFAEETENVEKILWFGESNTGKTQSAIIDVLRYLASQKVPPEHVMFCVIFPDRATGITKLYHLIPQQYRDRVFMFTINDYEDLISATASAEDLLMEHYKKTKVHGWMIIELAEEAWRMSQDYYSRKSFGETLADLMSAKRRALTEYNDSSDERKKESAYQALEGWRDWTVIKFFHNFNWIDKIKRMPFNVAMTSEIKAVDSSDSIFFDIKHQPAGEKDNVHRFDTVIYKKHIGNKFTQRCFKLTGYSRLYNEVDITDKNSYAEHKKILRKFDEKGYHLSAIDEAEEEAKIVVPEKVKEKVKSLEEKKIDTSNLLDDFDI